MPNYSNIHASRNKKVTFHYYQMMHIKLCINGVFSLTTFSAPIIIILFSIIPASPFVFLKQNRLIFKLALHNKSAVF